MNNSNRIAVFVSVFVAAGAQATITGASLTLADFSNGYVNADGSTVAIADPAPAGADQVWRLWATVTSATDIVAFFGASADDGVLFHMSVHGGTMYNERSFGNDIDGPNHAFFGIPGFGGTAYDSFLTIGHDGSSGTSGSTSVSDDGWLAGWTADGNFATLNGGLFDTSPSAGEDVVSDGYGGFRVLLGQFTLSHGACSEGSGRIGGGGQSVDISWHSYCPTPGALALFGVVGLAGVSRRRQG
ncbi:MAG: hypothetical protein KC983_01230 [Phycisphaerales bacterium]|nr:hypothetical protein [Phycisphaerales bacterium]